MINFEQADKAQQKKIVEALRAWFEKNKIDHVFRVQIYLGLLIVREGTTLGSIPDENQKAACIKLIHSLKKANLIEVENIRVKIHPAGQLTCFKISKVDEQILQPEAKAENISGRVANLPQARL